MNNNDVIIVCGVPGAGKTWVCTQLKDKYHYVPHDQYFNKITQAIKNAKNLTTKPIITEVPFAERPFREELESVGFNVHPIFVIEKPHVIAQRFRARENKPPSKSSMTRATTIEDRAKEWGAFYGTSEQVLEHLKNL